MTWLVTLNPWLSTCPLLLHPLSLTFAAESLVQWPVQCRPNWNQAPNQPASLPAGAVNVNIAQVVLAKMHYIKSLASFTPKCCGHPLVGLPASTLIFSIHPLHCLQHVSDHSLATCDVQDEVPVLWQGTRHPLQFGPNLRVQLYYPQPAPWPSLTPPARALLFRICQPLSERPFLLLSAWRTLTSPPRTCSNAAFCEVGPAAPGGFLNAFRSLSLAWNSFFLLFQPTNS